MYFISIQCTNATRNSVKWHHVEWTSWSGHWQVQMFDQVAGLNQLCSGKRQLAVISNTLDHMTIGAAHRLDNVSSCVWLFWQIVKTRPLLEN